ncbi:phosphotransferase [Planococcus sp. APC 4015]|nr:phosphotransferase [Planococcus sp. APC 4015]
MEVEHDLAGGNPGGSVIRIGSTVRKSWNTSTPSVFEYMTAVRNAEVDVPAVYGRDDQGRQVTEFIPGRLAIESDPLTRSELSRIGAMVRAIHDASAAFVPAENAIWETAIPAPNSDLVCHNDLAPWNLIIGERWVFIDWDASAPSTRLWDLAYAAQAFTLSPHQTPERAAQGLSAFIDGYEADRELRASLPETLYQRAQAMLDLLTGSHRVGREPWATMFVDGHGDHWRAATDFAGGHRDLWKAVLLPAR